MPPQHSPTHPAREWSEVPHESSEVPREQVRRRATIAIHPFESKQVTGAPERIFEHPIGLVEAGGRFEGALPVGDAAAGVEVGVHLEAFFAQAAAEVFEVEVEATRQIEDGETVVH